VARLQQAQTLLAELRTRYTDQHPDVLAQQRLIQQIEAQLKAAPAPTEDNSPVMIPNPVYGQLQTKLFDEEANVAVQRQRVDAAAAELTKAKNEASQAIDILAKYTDLDRDYGNIDGTYKELLQSREAGALSQARDDQNQGVSFRILEPPQRPQFPAGPNRPLLNSLVLVTGIAGAVALSILLTLSSGRFVTSDDLTSQFGVPLIGIITSVPEPPARRRQLAALALTASIAFLILSYVGVLAMMRTSIYSVLGV
jgi:uncharacterized protein involved in exopolysaccharide biosynthesis